ncbi:thiamine phosphate synthase [Duganella sp. Root336D2]|uniref:thiamine phosphate synthase n=1 Tax=Duganella sp. Root336D2 TaxID=1736518 RepID=UPI0006F814AA|nr:thiamine phosphate synthase [Duganella sp. Root336D2]KQV51027.1 thiamine-phosphate pyrophosphorylase [Duganella sp. Root336D2]
MQGLYLVTPNWDDTDKLLEVSEQALRAGVALLQYRHKDASAALRREQGGALRELCHKYSVPFLVNDHVALCRELGADGVHLGGTDAPLAEVRASLGPNKLIGASCYGELARAQAAQAAGASYVAFGGFYPSKVKQYAVTTQPSILRHAREVIGVPLCVIGGMTAQNAAPLVAEGAQMVAAITSVYLADDVVAAVREFQSIISPLA